MGTRELADIILPPFEMAVHEGGARAVMHSYAEIDGVPTAADENLLTALLRDTWASRAPSCPTTSECPF